MTARAVRLSSLWRLEERYRGVFVCWLYVECLIERPARAGRPGGRRAHPRPVRSRRQRSESAASNAVVTPFWGVALATPLAFVPPSTVPW